MKLYGFPPSPRTWQVRAAAAYLGIPLELVVVDLTKGEQRQPAYLAINPTGRAPTLVDGDFKLGEAAAILQYLASLKPGPLWPDDTRTRADIMRWQSWAIAHWDKEACVPLVVERFIKKLLDRGPADEAAVALALENFHKNARVLDDHLARQRWLVGDEMTLAEFAVAASLFYAQQGGYPLADYPHIVEWFGRVSALPCWQETAPQQRAAAA
ncbi:MAG TPA: glutathione S-transferase family protein [Pseudolabrys sp.]|jgi:glutathione S-transferase|nr:glutathione S-transferase family protein [Pseudolabrys sp.]